MIAINFVRYEVRGHIAIVTFSRPPVNALNVQSYEELRETFGRIAQDTSVRAAILRAEGKTFMAGNDVNEFVSLKGTRTAEHLKLVNSSVEAVYNCRVPVIAAVHGAVAGAGCGFVGCSDIVLASDRAKFSIPEVWVGLVGGAKNLLRLLPPKLVRYYALTGEAISAEDMKRYGGVIEVLPEDRLVERALKIAEQIARLSPLAVEYSKKYLKNLDYINGLEGHNEVMNNILLNHEDSVEAVKAFLEKRAPMFKGHSAG